MAGLDSGSATDFDEQIAVELSVGVFRDSAARPRGSYHPSRRSRFRPFALVEAYGILVTVPEPGPSLADFTNADASNPSALIAYLDAVSRAGVEDKRKTYEAQRLATGMRVLDVGCGTGDDVRAIAEIVGPSGKVVGIDTSVAMIAEARKRGVPENVEFVRGCADALPFEANAFDACRAERVFLHLRNPDAAASELQRVLRDGGSAFLLDPDWEALLIGSADMDVTRRITRALADRFANPWAGRNAVATLR